MTPNGRGKPALAAGVIVTAVTAAALLVAAAVVDPGVPVPAEPSGLVGPSADPVRRLPVAGRAGYTLVIGPDGATHLEAPDGERTPLTGPRTEDEPPAPTPAKPPEPAKPAEPGQLIVTDTGVVSVPKTAVVTFVGRDRVVTHQPDGESTVYFVSGRVVAQTRLVKP